MENLDKLIVNSAEREKVRLNISLLAVSQQQDPVDATKILNNLLAKQKKSYASIENDLKVFLNKTTNPNVLQGWAEFLAMPDDDNLGSMVFSEWRASNTYVVVKKEKMPGGKTKFYYIHKDRIPPGGFDADRASSLYRRAFLNEIGRIKIEVTAANSKSFDRKILDKLLTDSSSKKELNGEFPVEYDGQQVLKKLPGIEQLLKKPLVDLISELKHGNVKDKKHTTKVILIYIQELRFNSKAARLFFSNPDAVSIIDDLVLHLKQENENDYWTIKDEVLFINDWLKQNKDK